MPQRLGRLLIELTLLLTLLAMATQLLNHRRAFGGEIPAQQQEKFVARASSLAGTLELRTEATILGRDVKLRQICRWSESQNQIFEPLGDLIVGHLDESRPYHAFSLVEIKDLLNAAGVNVAPICFAGATTCMVSRGDVKVDEQQALRDWIASSRGERASSNSRSDAVSEQSFSVGATPAPPTTPAAGKEGDAGVAPPGGSPVGQTLRDGLTLDLADRLKISRDDLQIGWNPKDDKLLNLAQGAVKFAVTPRRVFNLGYVSWEVSITAGKATQTVNITADARAWQKQLVAAKPIAAKQVIRDEDLAERRVLVDLLDKESLLVRGQAVGQQASQEIKMGTPIVGRLVEAVPLVRNGQIVTVTILQGGIRITAAGRSMENGSYGQTIRVRNEETRDVYEVTVTGAQQAVLSESKNAEPVALGK